MRSSPPQPRVFDPFPACLYCDDPVEHFEPGPKGGASQNMTCRGCGTRYNLAFIVGVAVRFNDPHQGGEVVGRGGDCLFLEVLAPPTRPG